MQKEMIVSASPHETKLAILEDNQVTELYFEREKQYSLAGSIYKGRVTRVLPGMQSAFVDVGLERDAFLYVSDFFEDLEEYDKVVTTVEEKVSRLEESRLKEPSAAVAESVAPVAPSQPVEPAGEIAARSRVPESRADEKRATSIDSRRSVEAAPAASVAPEASGRGVQSNPDDVPPRDSDSAGGGRRFSRRGRHRRGQGRGFPESKYARKSSGPPAPSAPAQEPAATPIILPGESLAKYKDWQGRGRAPEPEQQSDEQTPVVEAAIDIAPEQMEGERLARRNTGQEAADDSPELNRKSPAISSKQDMPAEATNPDALFEAPGEAVSEAPSEATIEAAADLTYSKPGGEWDEEQAETSMEMQSATEQESYSETLDVIEADEETLAEESPEADGDPADQPGTGGKPKQQQAAVREGGRNARYQRRGRWGRRQQGQGQGQGREPQRQQRGRPAERETPKPLIADLLKEGQEIIVQIAKEPLGKKGARITSHIALPGRYVVYMPTVEHVGVSRKIASEEERHRLKKIILEHRGNNPGGFIVRTAGEGCSEQDLQADIRYLTSLWADIRAKAERSKAPTLLHHDLDLVLRTVRDQLSEEFTAVWVDNEQQYENMVSLVSRFQPALVHRVKLYTKDLPLFEEMGIQEEINKALKPKVWLKSGGYIVINQTEALVAIDVNTGKFVGKSNRLEDTIVRINVEAVQEIVRQIRLRDLGGIIVIDFIDMDERKNRQKVMSALEDAVRHDRAPSKILAFNEFGLVAITRKRVRQPLERTLCQPCADCGGSGFVKSVASVCLEIFGEARRLSAEWSGKQITVRVNPEVGKALKSRDNTIIPDMEEMTGKPVIIRNDPMMHVENFQFE